jgi:ADP-heptose:LPS heptosyltransferase
VTLSAPDDILFEKNKEAYSISLDLSEQAGKIKQKVKSGQEISRDQLYVLLLYHCFFEGSFPGTQTNVNLQPLVIPEKADRIAVFQFTKLGDVYTTFPLLSCLKEKFKPEELVFYTDPAYADALEGVGEIDRIVTFPINEWRERTKAGRFDLNLIPGWLENQPEFDLIVNCHDSLRSALLTELIDAGVTWGLRHYSRGGLRVTGTAFGLWKLLYPYLLEINGYSPADLPDRFPVARQNLLRFGFSSETGYKLDLSGQRLPEQFSEVEKSKKSVGLILAGGWKTKRWPKERWKDLARELDKNNYGIHLIGGGDVEEIAGEIIKEVPAARDWCGRLELAQTTGVLEKMDLVVSNDTGPLHLAGWLGKPLIILSGPTRVGASGREAAVMIQSKIDCAGCQQHQCDNEVDRECMREIAPELVYSLIEDFFEKGFEFQLKMKKEQHSNLNFYLKKAEDTFSYYPYPETYETCRQIKKVLLGWLTTGVINEINAHFHPDSGRLLGEDWLEECAERPDWNLKNLKRVTEELAVDIKQLKQYWRTNPREINFAAQKPLGPLLAGLCMFGAQQSDVHLASRQYQEIALELMEKFIRILNKEIKNV